MFTDDVDALGGVCHAAAAEVVDCLLRFVCCQLLKASEDVGFDSHLASSLLVTHSSSDDNLTRSHSAHHTILYGSHIGVAAAPCHGLVGSIIGQYGSLECQGLALGEGCGVFIENDTFRSNFSGIAPLDCYNLTKVSPRRCVLIGIQCAGGYMQGD